MTATDVCIRQAVAKAMVAYRTSKLFGALAVAMVASHGAAADEMKVPNTIAEQSCTLQSGGYRTVARIIDGETLALDDGREVRLVGALAPRASDAGAASGAWPIETESIRVLTALVLGRSVKLAFGDQRTDRYGRYLAHVFVGDGVNEKWVQGELLAAGAARAYSLPGSFNCSMELLAHERAARSKHRGVWSISLYRMKLARATGPLLQRRGRFEIVSGAVADVSPTTSATYLNFGRDWKSDFTARIAKKVLAANPDFARTLTGLHGKRIAVRGWIERRNGPLIDILHPDQIEVLDEATASPELSQNTLPKPAQPASAPQHDSYAASPGTTGEAVASPSPEADDTFPQQQRPSDPSLEQPGAVDL